MTQFRSALLFENAQNEENSTQRLTKLLLSITIHKFSENFDFSILESIYTSILESTSALAQKDPGIDSLLQLLFLSLLLDRDISEELRIDCITAGFEPDDEDIQQHFTSAKSTLNLGQLPRFLADYCIQCGKTHSFGAIVFYPCKFHTLCCNCKDSKKSCKLCKPEQELVGVKSEDQKLKDNTLIDHRVERSNSPNTTEKNGESEVEDTMEEKNHQEDDPTTELNDISDVDDDDIE